jgi:hypothetical protein
MNSSPGKRFLRGILAAALAAALGAMAIPPCLAAERWEGVDTTVVEKFAATAGRHARPSWFSTDQGDLGLFLFLTAGAVGGFIAGYTFRALFPPRKARRDHAPTR